MLSFGCFQCVNTAVKSDRKISSKDSQGAMFFQNAMAWFYPQRDLWMGFCYSGCKRRLNVLYTGEIF